MPTSRDRQTAALANALDNEITSVDPEVTADGGWMRLACAPLEQAPLNRVGVIIRADCVEVWRRGAVLASFRRGSPSLCWDVAATALAEADRS